MARAELPPQSAPKVNAATRSMTGFAAMTGGDGGWSWAWELRSVNAKGLDLRMRMPDWIAGLEAGMRARLQAACARGSVTVSLRVSRDTDDGGVDRAAIEASLRQIAAVEAIAATLGRPMAPVRAVDVLGLRPGAASVDPDAEAALRDALLAQADAELIPAFLDARIAEGQALEAILMQRLDEIAGLTERAVAAAAERRAAQGDQLRAALNRIANEVAVDPDRLAQELALLAVKQDVSEEIDRLRAHVDAGKDLVRTEGSKGRRLDFLMQEFNREANTLCSKSQDRALTAIGLDLKTAIDQLREQVQNVE